MIESIVHAVNEIDPAFRGLLGIIVYLLGLIAFVQGFLRLKKHSEDPYRAPSGMGTALTFVLGAGLLALPSFLNAAGGTFFGGTFRDTASLAYTTSSDTQAFNSLLNALFTIISLIGLIAFIRGWFVLRNAADGRSHQTIASGFWYLVGGIMAWHMVSVIDAIQQTLGISVLTIN